MFRVSTARGFLPIIDPLVRLPGQFQALEQLLHDMRIVREDGSPGLLAEERLGSFIDSGQGLPEYDLAEVLRSDDLGLLHGLFRDYCFVASAYLLEPCHRPFLETGRYGPARTRLPRCIAVPLAALAARLNARPFMEYSLAYALMNWRVVDPSGPMDRLDNLRTIRLFEGTASESGFILVHVAMVSHSARLVQAAIACLEAAEQGDAAGLGAGLGRLHGVLVNINQAMERMWRASQTRDYNRFRTFIMGMRGQPMFPPEGVVYEGVVDPDRPGREAVYCFRGESGANDNIIPLSDNLLQLTEAMPDNPLTDILRDFRSYRPACQNAFLADVERLAKEHGLRRLAADSPIAARHYLLCLEMVREFRTRHWHFTKEYILKFSDHPVATGGSPIVAWLPNQLRVVLQAIVDWPLQSSDDSTHSVKARARAQLADLNAEVELLGQKYNRE